MAIHDRIREVYATSAGSYPELVKKLIAIGVLSYTVDVATATMLYRFAEGDNILHEGNKEALEIASVFNQEKTIEALRLTQQGGSDYPTFLKNIAKAGVRFYEATLNGPMKRVTYIGTGGVYEEVIIF